MNTPARTTYPAAALILALRLTLPSCPPDIRTAAPARWKAHTCASRTDRQPLKRRQDET